jgi:hypothetical protein
MRQRIVFTTLVTATHGNTMYKKKTIEKTIEDGIRWNQLLLKNTYSVAVI